MSYGTPYRGRQRRLVIAFDVGTTYSGISYRQVAGAYRAEILINNHPMPSILDPGQIPEIKGVTRFPGHPHSGGSSKIPTVIYYDRSGKVRAVGAEAEEEQVSEISQEENWIKAEWYFLHLRSKYGDHRDVTQDIPPLPLNKTVVHVLADFLKYLFQCASSYIQVAHANGESLWKDLEGDIDFVLSHPNGWEGKEQAQMRKAALLAGLVADTTAGHSRLSFVTEGEASLHFSVRNGLPDGVMNNGEGIIIVDAGGGTIDISSYCRTTKGSQDTFEEIAIPRCHFHGSVFVTIVARASLKKLLDGSPFIDDIDLIARTFDATTKLRFKDRNDPQYIRFGSARDNDETHNIRFGQLKLPGAEVASFFRHSVDCIVKAVLEQRNSSKKPTAHVVFVGGFSASPWLISEVKAPLQSSGLTLFVPESPVNKAVSDGAVSFYLDHFVRTRVSKLSYGAEANIVFNPVYPGHKAREGTVYDGLDGSKRVPNGFDVVLTKDIQVSETKEFRKKYIRRYSDNRQKEYTVPILGYRGSIPNPQWIDEDKGDWFELYAPENYMRLCSIQFDISNLLIPCVNKVNGSTYYEAEFSIVMLFGLTEFKVQFAWMEDVMLDRSPAKIIYDPDTEEE
ncbi:hypothetical protein GALMADRAFT_75189 [Galerina marginata CBS 339.88]|uniref:Uncharacterized protein n=1 Tax=Galerina marginata (strain CBS 339.88) TaxID=685588 RepID=A0A067SME4_GALM3|nr:hypothetical protein GALMADRAFT_75189 [Galerina marginata CBS 339.88]